MLCSRHVGSYTSPANDWTHGPCIGSMESQPLDRQGSHPPWSPNRPAPPHLVEPSPAINTPCAIQPSPTGCLSMCWFLMTGSFWKEQITLVYSAASLMPGKSCAQIGRNSSMRLPFNELYALGSVLSPLHGLANKPQNGMRWVWLLSLFYRRQDRHKRLMTCWNHTTSKWQIRN